MEPFEYNVNPSRVVFGKGMLKTLPEELKRLGVSKCLVVCSPPQAEEITRSTNIILGQSRLAGLYTKAAMHTPISVTEDAVEFATQTKADSLVSIGGGSAIGLGKAISIRTSLPHIAVPTTLAGSEMTPILGESRDGIKTTRSDPRILPSAVIYDVDLVMTLPTPMVATSGINAIAHAVEAMYTRAKNPITSMFALEGVKSLAESLPKIIDHPQDVVAREKAQYGAWLCGTVLGTVGMALHHKLCHTLGGSFNLPHAETHTIVLPHALSYNAPAIPEVMKQLADAFPSSGGDAVKGLDSLLDYLKVTRGLKEFGMKEEDIDKAADIAVRNSYWNPRSIEREPLRELIRRCWAGEPARADL